MIFSLIALMLLFVFGVLAVRLSADSLLTAKRQSRQMQAFDLAEAGADKAEAYLRNLSSPPPLRDYEDYISYPTNGSPASVGGAGTYRVKIHGVEGNEGAWQKSYIIVATGTTAVGGLNRQVVAKVKQRSFAMYSYFTDQERSPVTNDTIWFYARDRLYGPVHTNDRLHVSWSPTSADPIFYGTVSSVAAAVDWGTDGAPRTTRDWRRVLDGGQAAMTLGVQRIPLPLTSWAQRNAAWGADDNFPSNNGIYFPSSGSMLTAGTFVRGDCTINFSVENGTGNQVVTVVQGSTTRTITVDREDNETRVRRGAITDIYSGVPNGVIYCTGNITSLRGTLADNYEDGERVIKRNAWTVATDVSAGRNITITNNLAYRTPPDSTKPPTHNSNLRAATLGLVAEDVVVSTSCPNEMTINGVILAGGENTTNGTFYYAGWNGQKRNNLHILGGIIQKKRGPVCTFNSHDVLQTGYNKDYRYDPRMADTPPPFFPTTGGYDVLSWQYVEGRRFDVE
ncbi:MAG: hypothetical protein ACYDCO_22805 [Armatimonadota bacterium]